VPSRAEGARREDLGVMKGSLREISLTVLCGAIVGTWDKKTFARQQKGILGTLRGG